MKFWEAIGWYGLAAVLAGYFLNSFGYIQSNGFTYLLLNLTGGAAIALISYQKRAFQPMVLNIVWLVIALFGLLKFFNAF